MDARRNAPRRASHSGSHGVRRRAGTVLGSQNAVHAQLDPGARRPPDHQRSGNGDSRWNVNSPTSTIVGSHKAFTLGPRSADECGQFKAMIVTYRNPVRRSGSNSLGLDGVEIHGFGILVPRTTRSGAITLASAPARHEHHRGRRCRERSCPSSRRSSGERPHGRALRPVDTIRESYRDVSYDGADARPRDLRHLRLPSYVGRP